jgi:hypothetical protein
MGIRARGSRSAPERYDFWTKAGLYVTLAILPALALQPAPGERFWPDGLAAFLLPATAQAAITVAIMRASRSHYLARGPKPNFNQPVVGAVPASMSRLPSWKEMK